MKRLMWMAMVSSMALAGTTAAMAAEADRDEAAREYFTDRQVIDQNGKRLRFYSDVLADRVVLLNVFYTNCIASCPLTTQLLKQTRGMLVDVVKDDVWFVSVSTDPERDTPEAMTTYAKSQGVDDSRWLFLTGTKEDIDLILKKVKRYTPNMAAHSRQMLAGTTRGRHEWIPLSEGVRPEAIAAVLRILAEKRPG